MEQSVTVIRMRDKNYVAEEINTAVLLPGSGISNEENRQNTIARLRKDPSVALIIDADEGRYEETIVLNDEFEVALTLDWDATPLATILVTNHHEAVFTKEYASNGEDEDIEEAYTLFLCDLTWILSCIDRNEYFFFMDEQDPLYPSKKSDRSLEIADIHLLLDEGGYQTEKIHLAADDMDAPILLVHENEVAMIASRHFSGHHLFVELKRFFVGCPDSDVEAVIDRIRSAIDEPSLEISHKPDGSWSFRVALDEWASEDTCLEHLLSRIEVLHSIIDKTHTALKFFPAADYCMDLARQYFIYETIATSLDLSRLTL